MTTIWQLILVFVLSAPLMAQGQPDFATCNKLYQESARPVEALRSLVREHPNSAWAHHFLAEALSEQGQLEAADKEFWLAIKEQPQQAYHYDFLSRNAETRHRLEKAIAALQEAIRLETRPEYRQSFEARLRTLEEKLETRQSLGDGKSLNLLPTLLAFLGLFTISALTYLGLRN